MNIGVKFCGGCNPRHDRVAFFESVKKAFAKEQFMIAQKGQSYEVLLVINGCTSRCCNVSGIHYNSSVWVDCNSGTQEIIHEIQKRIFK